MSGSSLEGKALSRGYKTLNSEIHRSNTLSWRERERASGSSPSECCLRMGWIWISDVTAYVITVCAITVYPCTQALGGHQELGYEAMPFHRQRYKATHTGYTQLSALPAQMGITKSMTKQTTNVSMLLLRKRKAGYNFHLTVYTCSPETINNKLYVCGIPHSESHMKTCKHSVIPACKHVSDITENHIP